jgi:2-hydroxy-3-oxopropionate reductase
VTEPLQVGFIGLGVMGTPMAMNILAANFPLHIYSRTRVKVDEVARQGGIPAPSAKAVAAAADIVIVMVPDTGDLASVLTTAEGILTGAHPDLIVVAMGTYDPAEMPRFAAMLAARQTAFVDAPVSGGEVAARAGTLSVMVGGDDAAVRRARPVLESMASRVIHIGAVGAGQIAKACNQLIVGSTIQAVAEALSIARAAGVDPAVVREAMLGGFASSRVLELHGRRMLEGDFAPGARVALHAKDAEIVLATAERVGVPVVGFRPVAAAFRALVDRGGGDLDHSALIELLSATARTKG